MGKKKGKKVSGSEKTAKKTEKNAEKKAKKELRKTGEQDIEELIAEFKEKDRQNMEIKEVKCAPPSARCNMSFTTHPERDVVIMFGGEVDSANKTFVYNDMYYYNLKHGDWTQVISANAPPPRCSHQAVVTRQGGGQLWIFGGEFVSPSQSQFHHWKDLWVYHMKDKQWEKVKAIGGPSSRSGHRMVLVKKQLIVFGGFHDKIRDFSYFNDIYSFNLETYKWSKLEPNGQGPSPRSGCQMLVNDDQNGILIYGGYSKERVKKDVDVGHTHNDMFQLLVDDKKSTDTDLHWKWQPVKQTGARPSPRCGMTAVKLSSNMAFFFGGVFDEEEDEEEVKGIFYDEMYTLEINTGKWHTVSLRGTKEEVQERKKRRKQDGDERTCKVLKSDDQDKAIGPDTPDVNLQRKQEDENTDNMDVEPIDIVDCDRSKEKETDMQTSDKMEDNQDSEKESNVHEIDDGIFKVTIGGAVDSTESDDKQISGACGGHAANAVVPTPRMNSLMTVKRNLLYLYGGLFEEGDKQITYDDLYVLDLHKMDTWKVLEKGNSCVQQWEDSESDSSEDDEEDDDVEGAEGMTVDL